MAETAQQIFEGAPLVEPTDHLAAEVAISREEADRLCAMDPPAYWAEIANELHWTKPWDEALAGGFPEFRYFPGGHSNVSYNCVDRHAETRPNDVAFYWEREDGARETWTWSRLRDDVARFANVMKRLGVSKGDRVALYMSNIPEVFVAIHACYRIGAIYSVIFAGFSEKAVSERLVDATPKVVVVADASVRRGKPVPLKKTLDAVIGRVPSVERVIVVPRMGADVAMKEGRDVLWADLMAKERTECEPEPIEANDPGFIIYTSGTTSKPKGLVHSGIGFLVGAYANVKWSLDLKPNDVYWCTADVGWLTFPIFALVGGLAHGTTHVVYEGALDVPDAGRFYEVMERYGVNKIFTAPTALRMLRRAGEQHMEGHDLSKLELVSLVGEPLDPETWYWTRDHLGGGRIFWNNTYGQTETGTAWASGMVGLTPTKPGSCGHALPGYKAEVMDDNGKPAPAGQLGVLTLTEPFPCLARTVWGDPDRYVATYFSTYPGRYMTHDAALFDPDGQLWVTGRVDDVINVAGHRIGTMELEAALINHPAVSEAAVIGISDEVKGMVPMAFVILRAGKNATPDLEKELAQQIVEGVGPMARPKRVVLTHTLPRTRSGKIMRRLLRDLADDGQVKGDTSALENPEAVEEVRAYLAKRAQ